MTIKCALLIPLYNMGTIHKVLDGLAEYQLPIIIVDDGSDLELHSSLQGRTGFTLLKHDTNCGKGAALRTGFEFAFAEHFTHVISLDADSIERTTIIPQLLEQIESNPEALWVGTRSDVEAKSKNRNSVITQKVDNILIKLFTGCKLLDSQSSFRAYPLRSLAPLELRSNRFEYEQEVLLEASWSGVELKEFELPVVSISSEEQISHYHPLKDLLRIGRVYASAMIKRFVNPFASLKVEGKTSREKIANLVKQELVSHTTPLKGAFAFSLGVFMGVFPIHGFQVVSLMFLATKLKLNRPLAFLGVNISAPPFLPFLAVIAVKLGDLLLPGSITSEVTTDTIEKGGVAFAAFLIGSALLAPLFALLAFILSYPIFCSLKRK